MVKLCRVTVQRYKVLQKREMKHILRNINILNILLIVAILLLINYTILPLLNMDARFTLPSIKNTPVHKEEITTESTIPSLTDYTMIAEDNLFHPERVIPAEEPDSQPLEQPEFVLYGTLITDGVRVAYLEDLKSPRSTQGRGRRQTVVNIGDTLSGFTLKEIHQDKVIMVRGQDTMVVDLLDSSSKKTRETKPPSEKQKSPSEKKTRTSKRQKSTPKMPKPPSISELQKQMGLGGDAQNIPLPMEKETQ